MDTEATDAQATGTSVSDAVHPSVPIDDDWIEHHFDPLSPELAPDLYAVLARARSRCPLSRSDRYDGGFWVLTKFEDIRRVAQDWRTFSSELGITVPHRPTSTKILPVTVDPPLQREFRRVVNRYFTPAAVSEWEEPTRRLVTRLIDGFIEVGACDFMSAFARPLPGLTFFDLALHAPAEDLAEVNRLATLASQPHASEQRESHGKLAAWIAGFVAQRRREGPRGDVVDAVLGAEIEGRRITEEEAIGTIHLLILGGLETTAGALGMIMLRFCEHPEIPELLREQPGRIPDAVEELLRLDGSFVCEGRTARHDAELGGRQIQAGERVIVYWASANRDEEVFADPEEFLLGRDPNPHIAFGAGTHRCPGSNLARMNIRIALEELTSRLHGVRLEPGAVVEYHSTFNRAPLSLPILFTPGQRAESEHLTPPEK